MSAKPTIKDVAKAAGVSATTVERALNGRVKVSVETLAKIAQGIEAVGYRRGGSLPKMLRQNAPKVRFGFVLSKGRQEFYREMAQILEETVARHKGIIGHCHISYVPSQSPQDIARVIQSVGAQSDAIAAVAVNHPAIADTVAQLQEAQVPTFALFNDFAQKTRGSYLGLNNVKAGRTAAWMIHRCNQQSAGPVAVIVGGKRWHGHMLREVGFRNYMKELAPKFHVVDTIANLETRQVTYEATLDLLDRQPDLRGLYVAGGGMEGAIAAIREARPAGRVSLVVHESTPVSRQALADGYAQMVIATPLQQLCAKLVEEMVECATGSTSRAQDQQYFEPRIVLPEMV